MMPQAPSIFSGGDASALMQKNLLDKMQENFQRRVELKSRKVAAGYDSKSGPLKVQQKEYRELKQDIGKSSSAISTFAGRAKSILSQLEALKQNVNKAVLAANKKEAESNSEGATAGDTTGSETEGATEGDSKKMDPFKGYALTLDALIRSIDNNANRAESGEANPLGEKAETYEYKVSRFGAYNKLFGNYLGSSYTLEADDGKVWKFDPKTKVLREYDPVAKKDTGRVANSQHGIELVQQTGDRVELSLGGANERFTVTGKLKNKGLGLLGAWAYEGLSTKEGREQALAAIGRAEQMVKLEQSRYLVAFKTAQYYEEKAAAQATETGDQVSDLQIQKAQEIQELQKDLARQYQVSRNALMNQFQGGAQTTLGTVLFGEPDKNRDNPLLNLLA